MPTKTAGGAVTDGWNIWSPGTISQSVSFPTSATYTFQIVARGDYAGGAWPIMELRDDWVVLKSLSVDSSAWKTFTVQCWMSAGWHKLVIAFMNDYYDPPADRNLIIDKLIIADTVADAAAPTVSLTAPAAGTTISGSVAVNATASDDVGVVGVQCKLDGANLGAEDVASPYSVTWDTKTTPNGAHTLTAVARDASGKSTTSSPVTVTVSNDVTPPTISGISATSTSTTSAAVSCVTDEPATCTVDYGSTISYGQAVTGAGPATSHTVSLTGLSTGAMYHYRMRCKDAAGNERAAADGTFVTQADTTPPKITFTSPKDGEILVAP